MINIINPDKPKTIWDPNSAFMEQLQIYKLKSEIKPRKVSMMDAQVAMIADVCSEDVRRKLYVPEGK